MSKMIIKTITMDEMTVQFIEKEGKKKEITKYNVEKKSYYNYTE